MTADPRSAAPAAELPADASSRLRRWGLTVLVAVLFVALFHPILLVRGQEYLERPRYSHCLLLPAVSLLWIWDRSGRLRAVPRAPSARGFALAAFGVLLFLYGRSVRTNLVQHAAMLVSLVGIVWALLGARMLRALAFPLAYLLLTMPLPKVWDDALTLPLQGFATGVAERTFDAFGWVVLRQGNVLQLPGIKLLVEEQCSGAHSLYALVALGLAWVAFVERPLWLRITLVLSAVPISIAANAIRVIVTGVLAYQVDPKYAQGLSHETAGMVVFGIGLALFLGLDWCLKPDEPESA